MTSYTYALIVYAACGPSSSDAYVAQPFRLGLTCN